MATNTYVALDTKTVTSAVASVTFTSIPQGYTDLRLVARGVSSGGDIDLSFRLNGDTGSNYSRTFLWGSGSAAGSGRNTNLSFGRLNYGSYWTTSNESVILADFMNYSNATTYKTVLSRDNNSAIGVGANVNLWRSTSAITSIEIYTSAFNIAVGSTFTLYGIAADTGAYTVKATGGTITTDQFWVYHTFTSSGTFAPTSGIVADVFTVAGGGGGGGGWQSGGGGGGGAGGWTGFANQQLSATSYTVTVGTGGAGGNGYQQGTNGTNSQFGSLTAAIGGGGGGFYDNNTATGTQGNSGGSGGGSGGGFYSIAGGAGTSGQGYAGGTTSGGSPYAGSGGGGAGAAGSGINGGAGIGTYSFWATATSKGVSGYFAGGGAAGGGIGSNGTAGSGGGGAANTNGTANTGSGGGGAVNYLTPQAGNGASGIVIIRYSK